MDCSELDLNFWYSTSSSNLLLCSNFKLTEKVARTVQRTPYCLPFIHIHLAFCSIGFIVFSFSLTWIIGEKVAYIIGLYSSMHNHSTCINFSKFDIIIQTVYSSIVTVLSTDAIMFVLAFFNLVQDTIWDHLLHSAVKSPFIILNLSLFFMTLICFKNS